MRALRATAAPLLGLLLAAGLLLLSRGLDEIAREGQLGPGFWPRLVLAGLGLACAAMLGQGWRRARGGAPTEPGAGQARDAISRGMLVASIALVILYALAAPLVGFPLATAAFIVLFLVLGGLRSPLAVAANAVVGTVILLYVFVKLVYLPLPKGAGPLEGLTIALYRGLGIF